MNNSDNLSIILQNWSSSFFRISIHDLMHFLRSSGLSMSQFAVLLRIYHHGPCEITDLVKILQSTKAGAGQLIERMEQQGLVERKVSEEDRRARIVFLTAQGKNLVEQSFMARDQWIQKVLKEIPIEQHFALAEVLQVLAESISKLENKSRS
jgi:DNA-binding MarR family transcriptional regulator